MATGRDDFVIAFRSAFLKKKDKQKFSLLSLILLSIIVIILSNINFKPIQLVKIGINEIIYRSSYIASKPENYLQELTLKIKNHINLFENYKDIKSELEDLKQEKITNNFLKSENEKLRNLINENINSDSVVAKLTSSDFDLAFYDDDEIATLTQSIKPHNIKSLISSISFLNLT